MPTHNTNRPQLSQEFDTLFEVIQQEVADLTEVHLNFTSDEWAWAQWSIRNQLSHMARLIPSWLITRFGKMLFPNNAHGFKNLDMEPITNSPSQGRLDDSVYWELSEIMVILRTSIDLVRQVLRENSETQLRQYMVKRDPTPQWKMMAKAHPSGVTVQGDPAYGTMTLEATIRHIYFEEITHLYNIQRLKKAQGIGPASQLPKVGYWVLEEWDRSEP